MKFDWDNDELEVNDNLEILRIFPKIPAIFLGLAMERDVIGAEGSPDHDFLRTPEVEIHEAKVNAGLIVPANEAPSIIDIVVDSEGCVSRAYDDVADTELQAEHFPREPRDNLDSSGEHDARANLSAEHDAADGFSSQVTHLHTELAHEVRYVRIVR